MSDTAERVKRCPYAWEQRLLNCARVIGGQSAVDEAARRIAAYNERCHARLRRNADRTFQEKVMAERIMDDDRMGLLYGLPGSGEEIER